MIAAAIAAVYSTIHKMVTIQHGDLRWESALVIDTARVCLIRPFGGVRNTIVMYCFGLMLTSLFIVNLYTGDQ